MKSVLGENSTKSLYKQYNLLTASDTHLSNCASSGIFGKVIIYFSHSSFYGIHHLFLKERVSFNSFKKKFQVSSIICAYTFHGQIEI